MTTRWIAVLLMTAISVPGWGQSQSKDRFDLTSEQIARTLSDRSSQITDRQVSLLASVVATEPHPLLDILSVEPIGDKSTGMRSKTQSLVKLGCHLSGRCLPFYVIVTEPAGPVERSASTSGASADLGKPLLKPNAAVIMRAGTHATLLMDDQRSHIQVAVISLENGIAGHRIRVASPDHKQIYVGEVVSASVLKRSF